MATSGADSVWSWVIAASCCWLTFVIQGLVRSGGVVYVALIDAYRVNRAQASWPFTLRLAVWNLSGPLAGGLSYKWSIRTITFCGVLLVTLTNVICWFAKDVYVVTFFLGGLQGLGVGMAVTLVPVIINQYFVKYKSTGAGIACAGATAGSFALPPIVELAIEEYGLEGAFLMMAGITLHGILGAALLRPAHWLGNKVNDAKTIDKKGDQNLNFLTTKSKNAPDGEEVKCLLNGCSNGEEKIVKQKTVRFSCSEEHPTMDQQGSGNTGIPQHEEFPISSLNGECTDEDRIEDHSENTQSVDDAMLLQSDTEMGPIRYGKLQFIDNRKPEYDPQINLQTIYIPSTCDTQPTSPTLLKPSIIRNGTHCPTDTKKRKWLQGLVEPLKAASVIVKHPMFLIIASNYCIFFLSYMTYLIVIVDYSLDLGVNRTDCVFLVSIFSIADLSGRLGSGWITDSGIVKRKHLMMVNMLTFGAMLVATSFANTYTALTAVSASAGLIVGINLILFYALLEEYLGLKFMPMAIGMMNFSIGVVSMITPVLTGYFRDTMGSYDHLFHLLGSVSILCGLLWVLEPVYARCNKKALDMPKDIPA